ncbi:hypothetical protein, partial [Klebsiella pneumoniae]|uniref:hypothetical protein n=1 Tax=Klebsiella pneumoniae TaxID=573 RepID=UPI0013C2AE9B
LKHIYSTLKKEELAAEKANLSIQAVKQKQVLDYFLQTEGPVEQRELLSILGVSSAVIKGLIQKGILSQKDMEV